MSVAVQIQLTGIARVQRALYRLSNPSRKELFDLVGNLVANQTRRRITHDKRAPDGSRWAPLSPRYAQRKAKEKPGVGMLEFWGYLRDSITHIASSNQVEVGSNQKYAAVHQFGLPRKNIPARPYIGLSRDNVSDVEDVARKWFFRRLGVFI